MPAVADRVKDLSTIAGIFTTQWDAECVINLN